LQEREYQPLGATSLRKADVRFAAATHQDLEAKVRAGDFREDLFYRLDVLTIRLPALRERGDDARLLAESFCTTLAKENGRSGLAFTDAALAALATHPFPGNVRELSNIVERLVVFSDGDAIGEDDVARELAGRSRISSVDVTPAGDGTLEERRAAAERAAIVDALARTGGNRTQAARLLGVSRRTLYNRLEELGIG
jgi:DNA-binding NtrC family response regulator